MNNIKLFRRRFVPDEIVELKDDKILLIENGIIVTRWDTLKPRKDIDHGFSAYFINDGIKVSKIFDADNNLVHWYCDIINTSYNETEQTYTFNDLMIDVIVMPDGSVKVVDLDEFADVLDDTLLPVSVMTGALKHTNNLLTTIYSGHFNQYTDILDRVINKCK